MSVFKLIFSGISKKTHRFSKRTMSTNYSDYVKFMELVGNVKVSMIKFHQGSTFFSKKKKNEKKFTVNSVTKVARMWFFICDNVLMSHSKENRISLVCTIKMYMRRKFVQCLVKWCKSITAVFLSVFSLQQLKRTGWVMRNVNGNLICSYFDYVN